MVPWARVSGFAAFAGRRPGLWVLPEGEAPLRVPTPWHRMSFAEAREASDAMNRACGIVPPHTWGADPRRHRGPGAAPPGVGSRRRRAAAHPDGQRPVVGDGGTVTAVVLAPLGLILPLVLCVLEATSPGDTSRPAQLAWVVHPVLLVRRFLVAARRGHQRTRLTAEGSRVRTCWRGTLRWDDRAGVPPRTPSGLIGDGHAPGSGSRAAVRLATSAGRERSTQARRS